MDTYVSASMSQLTVAYLWQRASEIFVNTDDYHFPQGPIS